MASPLQNEITTDPLERGYADMSDAEVAASLNAEDITTTYERFVTYRTLMAEIGATEAATIRAKIMGAMEAQPPLALAHDMLSCYETGGGIDFGHDGTRAFLDQMEAAELFTAEEVAACKSLGERLISRAFELGLGAVKEGYVARARGGA